jgi:asparagine synthase (glutamine-hydrolysing)
MTFLFDLFHGNNAPTNNFIQWIPGWWYNAAGFCIKTGITSTGEEWLLAGFTLNNDNISNLVDLYRNKGCEALFAADGQFILAIHDKKSNGVEIYRDRTGIVPIVSGNGKEGFLISIWPNNIVHYMGLTPIASKSLLRHYPLYRIALPPESPLDQVCFIPGRCSFALSADKISFSEHKMVKPAEKPYTKINDASTYLGQMLSEAVRKRVVGCKSISSWLSGGNDSSLLVALARKHFAGEIKTIFVTFEDYLRNYGKDASMVASMFDTKHLEICLSAREYVNLWAETIHTIQEPINSPCTIGQLGALDKLSLVSDIILSGEGADTVFGGPYWAPLLFLSRISGAMPNKIRQFARNLSQKFAGTSFLSKATGKGFKALGTPLREYMISELVFGNKDDVNRVFGSGTWDCAINDLSKHIGKNAEEDLFSVLLLDWLPVYNAALKRIGFKYGLTYCLPFLDYNLMQSSLRLPMHLRYHYSSKKAVLKKYASDFFDKSFVDKPKEGFGVPLGKWFARPDFEPFLKLPLEERSLRRGWWNEKALREIIEFHTSGYGNDKSAECIPWMTINLELWARICLEGESPELYKI